MFWYKFLVLLHILSAILGMGPGFIMIYIVTKATTLTELRHAYLIRNRLHVFVMVGGTLLLLSGLGLGVLNPIYFSAKWYIISLILFLIALAFGPLVLSPRSKPIKELLNNTMNTETIPEQYYVFARKLFFYERIENLIFITIIVLMVLKPF
mgnify:CR=1 FL=1